jgi:copper ion binding protein
LTGLVKVIKNLPGVYLSPTLITSMTLTHTFVTIFFLLGVLAHLAALIFKVNRPLTKSIFTGKVDAEYVRDRHTIWYEELMRREVKAEVEEEERGEEVRVTNLGTELGKGDEIMATVLKVKGMSCQHCVMSVTRALNQLEGVQNIQVDLEKREVRFDNVKGVAAEQIAKAIVDAGYEVVPS